jgi:signal transduction histidine kinase
VNFASLAPGTYEFEVRAVSGDGVVSPGVASFRFRVLPPLWQRWWFVMLVGLLLAVIVYQVYRYRVGRLLEMERVRTRIAADLHDDIGSSLSQIAVLSEVLRRKAGDDARLTKPLLQIASVSREAVDSMSDIVWAINPAKDHLQDLVKRMRRHASEVFPASHIEFHFDAPETAHDITLGADVRRQVFLIFKESVTNVIRHSHCDHAEVRLTVEGSQLVLEVIDNGKGFDPSRRNDGNGLVSMRRRASSLGGMLEVISASGTTIRLQVPYSSSRIRG